MDSIIPKITLEKSIITNNEITLVFDTNVNISMIRRLLLLNVPGYCIDEIGIVTNTSRFHDELLSFRLRMIPIIPTSENNTLVLNIHAESDIYVTSDDIQGEFVVAPGIVICKLSKGESIFLSGKIKKGTGRMGAEWSPIVACYFKNNVLKCETLYPLSEEIILKSLENLVRKVE